MVLLLFLIVSFFVTSSDGVFKFVTSKHNRRNVTFCKGLFQIKDDAERDILVEKPFSFQISRNKHLCFLKCLHQASGLINAHGDAELQNITWLIKETVQPTNYFWKLTEKDLNISSLNLIALCKNDKSSVCLKTVLFVECLNTMIHLINYGYVNDDIFRKKMNQDEVKSIYETAIRRFQDFFGLQITGIPDLEMLQLLYSPRCKSSDFKAKYRRSKRYVLAEGHKWNKLELTYKILNYPENLPKKSVEQEIHRAFKSWTFPTFLKTQEKNSGPTDIELEFVKYYHGDGAPFDGPGKFLAHTMYPEEIVDEQKSFIHFDGSENWTVHSKRGAEVYQVALHEIGHSLGLRHSNIPEAVMWPYMPLRYKPNFVLSRDDILGIQMLYGARPTSFEFWMHKFQQFITNLFY